MAEQVSPLCRGSKPCPSLCQSKSPGHMRRVSRLTRFPQMDTDSKLVVLFMASIHSQTMVNQVHDEMVESFETAKQLKEGLYSVFNPSSAQRVRSPWVYNIYTKRSYLGYSIQGNSTLLVSTKRVIHADREIGWSKSSTSHCHCSH